MSDPALARSHQAGASVVCVQPSEHARLGTIFVTWPKYWAFHYEDSHEGHERLQAAHEEVLSIAPDEERATRLVNDIDLVGRIYRAGVQLVLGSVLAVQHLCREIENVTQMNWQDGSTLGDRIAHVGEVSGLGNIKALDGYEGFVELWKQRDAVEHPKPQNTYDASGNWDRVPLAWLVSERPLESFAGFSAWFEELVERWEERRQELARPGIIQAEGRGMRSRRQFKKAPKNED